MDERNNILNIVIRPGQGDREGGREGERERASIVSAPPAKTVLACSAEDQ